MSIVRSGHSVKPSINHKSATVKRQVNNEHKTNAHTFIGISKWIFLNYKIYTIDNASVFRVSTFRFGWRCVSVVKTSVFGWRTFSDLCLVYGWHVTTSWVKCPLWVNQPCQLSLPSLRSQ